MSTAPTSDIVVRLRQTRDPVQREAASEIAKLRRLLERALDALPDFTDGRNDRLARSIDKALGREP